MSGLYSRLYIWWARIAVRLGLPHTHTDECGRFE